MKIWESFLTPADQAVVTRGRFGRRMGFGVRPAVVVIDAQKYMVGEAGGDENWPSSCGDIGRKAVGEIARIVETAQAAKVPCFFSLFELDPKGRDIGVYARKRDLLESDHWCLAGSTGAQMVSREAESD